jgi:glycosyltransferase involved in cell wall biosynthesis
VKNVLFVAYHFPPDAAVGAVRCQKFVKHLPDHGWAPHIVTVRETYYPLCDPSRLEDIKRARVWRTREFTNPRLAALGIRNRVFTALGRGHVLRRKAETSARMPFEEKQHVSPGLRASLRRALLSLCFTPDEHLGWLAPGLARAVHICRRHRIDGIVTTGPPQTSHLIGLLLKRLTGIRWVADFRDPWTGNPAKPRAVRIALSDRLDRALESAVVRGADRVVAVNEHLRDQFARDHPDQANGKFVTIWNGFDPDDFAAVTDISRPPEFTIAHVGGLYFRRSPKTLLMAVGRLIGDGKIPRSSTRLLFVGDAGDDGHDLDGPVVAFGLSDVVRLIDRLPYRDAIAWMCRADLLILLAQGQPRQIPGKAFEYLAAGSPILAITGEGATADLVRKMGGTVASDDPERIAAAIYHSYLRYRSGVRGHPAAEPWTRDEVGAYDRRRLAGQLAALLDGRAA